MAVHREFLTLAERFVIMREARLKPHVPPEPEPTSIATNYLWARTIHCPYCEGLGPLSPNWRLSVDGIGVRLLPHLAADLQKRRCDFQVVRKAADQSPGTVAGGDAACAFRIVGV
jgi:putative DNA methylase